MTHPDALIIIAEIRKLGDKPNPHEERFLRDMEKEPGVTRKQELFLQNIYVRAAQGGVYERRQYFKR